MIQIKALQPTNRETLTAISTLLNVDINQAFLDGGAHKCFVVEDGDRVIGYCLYEWITTEVSAIKQIYLMQSQRKMKLGDGLFRAVLNSIELNGGKHVVAIGNEEELSFYLHEGLTVLTHAEMETLNIGTMAFEAHNVAYLKSIADFFNAPCKGHKKI